MCGARVLLGSAWLLTLLYTMWDKYMYICIHKHIVHVF